jgi:hypothetical protein
MTDPEQPNAGDVGRITPYELIFGAPGFDAARFEPLREQAAAARAVTAAELLLLSAASELLRELLPVDEPEGAHREAVARAGALLFHAFRFWLHGTRVYELSEELLRATLERAAPVGEWRLRTPAPAGYVQLPHHLFWARVAEEAAAEPVDGFFFSAPTPDEGVRGERLDLLLVLGVRRGRPGVSLVDLDVEAGGELAHWADVDARGDGADFANVLPGGELRGYHSLTTRAEVLKLASLCFWLADTRHVVPVADGTPQSDGEAAAGSAADGTPGAAVPHATAPEVRRHRIDG